MFPIVEPIVVLVGPTAIGKTALSIKLARSLDFEILSMDSMQVYRYMDIGTAKITKEEMKGVRHHLIDVVDPDENFNAGLYENLALEVIRDVISRGKRVLITGGTGLYLNALLYGLVKEIPVFPEIRKELEQELERHGHDVLHQQLSITDGISAKRIHKNDTHRLIRALEIFKGTGKKWSSLIEEHRLNKHPKRFRNVLKIGLTCERDTLYRRINERSRIMIEQGLQREVVALLEKGYGGGLRSMQSIGYSHMVKFIEKELTESEMIEKLSRDTRRYAKRQYTWFNKIHNLYWFGKDQSYEIEQMVRGFINAAPVPLFSVKSKIDTE